MTLSTAHTQGRRGLVVLALASALLTVLCVALAASMARNAPCEDQAFALPQESATLQGTLQRPADAAAARAAALAQLRTYGWVDAAHTRVSIPIEVALDVWLAREGGAP